MRKKFIIICVWCTIIFTPLVLSPIIIDIYNFFNIDKKIFLIKEDKRVSLPNYKGATWVSDHFKETWSLKTNYYDYIIWRNKELYLKTININSQGYRLNNAGEKNLDITKKEVWFFGGSTMWGTGAPDTGTIPANFEKISSLSSANFGEAGYTSSQELNLLIKLISQDKKPKIVIFYNGVNDVFSKCRRESSFFSSIRENEIREQIYIGLDSPQTVNLLRPLQRVLKKLTRPFIKRNFENSYFDCTTNFEKSKNIINNLIINWQIAKELTEKNGGKFIPILQPVAFISNPRIDHLNLNDKFNIHLGMQYKYIYNELKKELDKNKIKYLDFTKILDGKEFCFIDFCHLSPNCNEKIAAKLLDELS